MNWADFHFIRPYWLLALIPALAVIIFSVRRKLNKGEWATVCDADLLPFILEEGKGQQSQWLLGTLSVAALLSIMALAGPTWDRLETPVFKNDAALVIALDLSQTMNASDIQPSRLSRARYKIADILRQRKEGVTALIVYSADAYTVTPLTSDVATIENQLQALKSNIMPRQGKNTESAIALAIQLLQQAGQKQGNIFLITDGIKRNVEGVKDHLKDYKVSILGVGTAGGGPVKLASGGFLKNKSGDILVPKLNAQELASLARNLGGTFITTTANDSDIKQLLSSIDRPAADSKNNENNGLIEQWNDRGVWLLLLVLPLAALSFRKGLLVISFLLILPLPETSYAYDWNALWLNNNQQAEQLFHDKKFEQAAEQFDSVEWKAAAEYKAGRYQQAADLLKGVETADGFYNLGNSYAQLGQFDKAEQAYKKSLSLEPTHEDAQHNLKVVEKAKKEAQNQGDQQSEKNQQGDQSSENAEEGNQQAEEGNQQAEEQHKDKPKNTEGSTNESAKQNPQQGKPSLDENAPTELSDLDNKPNENNDNDNQHQAPINKFSEEEQQAAEQWLNRIQDDPAGLLKRKFKYQYGQRQRD